MITLPRPEKHLLISIRTGEYGSMERVLDLANKLFAELTQAESESHLPEVVNRHCVSKIVSESYVSVWESTR